MLGTGANPLLLPNKSLLVLQKDLKSGKLKNLGALAFLCKKRFALSRNVLGIFRIVSDNLAVRICEDNTKIHDITIMS